jgi:hypothetical protein
MKILNKIKLINILKQLFKYTMIFFVTSVILIIVAYQFKDERGQAFPDKLLVKLVKKNQGVNNR